MECQSLSYRTRIPDFGTLLEEFPEGHGDVVDNEHHFFYPQTDDQSERTIQVLEDMLLACVLNLKGGWEEHLPSVEFAYNNSYQAIIQMAPYEGLYGRSCRSPIFWTKVGESSITSLDLIRDTSKKVGLIQKLLLTAQSRQKSYADIRR